MRDAHTDAAFFESVPKVDLEDHISILAEGGTRLLASSEGSDNEIIERLLPHILDQPWPASLPPWRIVVIPLSPSKRQSKEQARCFVAFSFSHALGDGIIALAFHRTFGDGLFNDVNTDCSVLTTPVADFPGPFDTAKSLPISWGFLLRPFIAVLLPGFVTEILGLRATTSTVTSNTWTGVKMFFEPESFHTRLRLVEIQGLELANVLLIVRKRGSKLTAIIHQAIVRALSKEITRSQAANFVSGTAVNMRRAVGISNEEMGFFTNVYYDFHDREDAWASPWSERSWESARSLTEQLAKCARTLKDQPLGLLRYVPSISKWTAAKIGKSRDSSYEVSNLGAFDGTPSQEDAGRGQYKITKMVFSRPANPTSAPITFSVVSIKGGSMVISIAWQPGALGIPLESEFVFVDGIKSFLQEDLMKLA